MKSCPLVLERHRHRCSSCGELGHTLRRCPRLSPQQREARAPFSATPFPDHLYFVNAIRGVLRKDPIQLEGRRRGVTHGYVEPRYARVFSEHELSWK